jgi:hypothetical protein
MTATVISLAKVRTERERTKRAAAEPEPPEKLSLIMLRELAHRLALPPLLPRDGL